MLQLAPNTNSNSLSSIVKTCVELKIAGNGRVSLLGELLRSCSTNNLSEHIVEHTDMPSHLVKTVSGQDVFEQTQPRVRLSV